MLLRRLKYPGTTGLILRRTHPELYKSHIIKLFEEFPQTRNWYNEQRKEVTFPNGSRLFFGSAEHAGDMNAFYSSEFADIMPDESQEFSQGELESLMGSNRCTSNSDITPKMIYTFMPGISETGLPPKGLPYLKRVLVDGDLRGEETRKNWAFIQAFSWDNIEWARKELEQDGVSEEEFYSWSADVRRDYFITRTDYGSTLASITDKDLRDAWLYGKWDVFKGQYYPNFSQEKHVIDLKKADLKPWYTRWISGDWGYDHPGVIHWHALDEFGNVTTYRELWGREIGEEDLGRRIGEMSAGEKIDAFYYSWDAFGTVSKKTKKSLTTMIGDGMPAHMPRPVPADKTPGSRISGWRLWHQLMNAQMWRVVGPSADYSGCPKLIETIPTLIRDPENTEDVLKVDWSENYIGDDCADSVRMGLQNMLSASMVPKSVQFQRKTTEIRKAIVGALPVSENYAEVLARLGAKLL